MYTGMLVQVRQCKMHKCIMHMHNATTNPRKQREKQTRPTKLTKEKSAIKRGNKPQAPLAFLVRISAVCLSEGTWIRSMCPLSWLSRRKWNRMSMCLVLECRTGFFAMLMADMLSTKMGTLPKLKP